jgi:type I restriction enzyme M protein
MLTGPLRNRVDRIWDAFWTGGISNPLEVIEQITYLLFLKMLDDAETLAENRLHTAGVPMDRQIFAGNQELRWSKFKDLDPVALYMRSSSPPSWPERCGSSCPRPAP